MIKKREESTRDVINSFYTPLDEACREIKKRRNDKKLMEKVKNFFKNDIPNYFNEYPSAVYVRDIISPDNEFFSYLSLIKKTDLEPLFIEYSDCKFVAKNYNKYSLCKMYFHNGYGKNGGARISSERIVNFNESEGKKMRDIKTIFGKKRLIDFHHEIFYKNLEKELSEFKETKIEDFSEWFNRHRNLSEYYYLHYLSLFILGGILFENFIISNGESEFTKEKIIPSFREAEKFFGVKPLVVPIVSPEEEDDFFWWCYPEDIKKDMNDFYVAKKQIRI